MTDIKELIEDLQAAQPAPSCKVCDWLASAPVDQRDAVRSGLASRIGGERLAAIFAKHDIPLGRLVIRKHRAHERDAS